MSKHRTTLSKTLLFLFLFFMAVFLLTYADWVVNGLLYQFGLRFDAVWYERYSLGYTLLWQFTVCLLAVAFKSWRLFVFMEAFVLSSTQDLIYFGVWNGGVFPVGDWTWMPLYNVLGFYNTGFQIVLSVVCVGSAILIIKMVKKCGCYYPEKACWKCQIRQALTAIKLRLFDY